MSGDAIPFPAGPAGRPPEAAPVAATEPLLVDVAALSRLTSLSVRTLRRIDSTRDIPGRVEVGRRVLFRTEVIREWVRAGLPGRTDWEALARRNGKR
jgi:hypothetical protein